MPFLIDTEKISELVVALLARDIVLPATVNRVPQVDYRGSGGTVTVRVPQRRTAQEQETPGAPINYSGIDETPVTVTVKHLYDASQVTDEDSTLALADFARQVLQPMVSAIIEGAENELASVMNAVTPSFGWTDLSDAAKTEADVLAAREALTKANVPVGNRFLAVSPEVASVLLTLDKLSRVDASGTDSGLRDATIGRVYGMQVVESNALDAETAVAYHSSGFAFATLSPAVPQGAASASQAVENGVAVRVVYDFSPDILSDVIAVSTFCGGAFVDAARVVRIGESESS